MVANAWAQDPFSGLWIGTDTWNLSGGGSSGTISFDCTLLFVGSEDSPFGGFLSYNVSEVLTCTAINLPAQITTTAVVGSQYTGTYDGVVLFLGSISLYPPGDVLGLDSADKAPYGSVSSPTVMTLTDTTTVNNLTTIENINVDFAEEPLITQEPSDAAVNLGGNASFSVAASGVISYQWYLNGVAIPNATAAVLNVIDVQDSNLGAYTVSLTNNFGTTMSTTAELAFNQSAPVFTSQPVSQTIEIGRTVVFYAPTDPQSDSAYQWYLNGRALASATSQLLVISGTTFADAGTYECEASNALGSAQSNPATLTIVSTANPGRLTNISCRAQVGTGADILIAGFVVGGQGTTGSESLLVRGSGPALTAFGVPGVLPDPQLQIYSGTELVGANNGWDGNSLISSEASAVGAFQWANSSSHDSALLESLSGGYTAQVAGQSGDTGVALAEVYDETPAGTYKPTTPRLVNISARVQVGSGGNILIAGFVIGGATSETVLIRASGPALASFGVDGTLPDPQLQLFSGTTLLGTNNGWGGGTEIASAASSVGAFAWTDPLSNDSAIIVSLSPGAYTAQVSGASGDTGIALVEVYEVP